MSADGESPGRLFLAAALVGALAGLVGAAFHVLLDAANSGRDLLRGALVDAPVPGWLPLSVLGALTLIAALWLVRRFAPETAGSGIQEVEAILAGQRDLRWRRVLPIKFMGGLLAVGSGLVLGREGPTVHMGAALGQLAAERAPLSPRQGRSLIAAGAAAGLAAAFNAPLAAIVFVTEELREHFEYGFASMQSVILACCMAVVVSDWALGQGPALPIDHLGTAPLASLPLFLVLGVLIGAMGALFNRLLLGSVRVFRLLREDHAYLVTGTVGLALGALIWVAPQTVGGGEGVVESLLHQPLALLPLVLLLSVRLLTTVGSYGVGLPGGIFAPMLALGTIAGAIFDHLAGSLTPGLDLAPGVFAVAAMGALFAATVRAPLTGIILVIELTGAHELGLPIILTCLSATFAAEGLGGRPIYSLLLARGDRPPVPMRWPSRRLAMAGMVLVALVLGDQLLSAWRAPATTLTSPATEIADVAPTPSGPETKPAERNRADARAPFDHASPASPASRAAVPASARPPIAPAPAPAPAPAKPREVAVTVEVSPPTEGHLPQLPEVANQQRYTIQLISFRKRASLAAFAQRNGILDQARVLETGSGDRGWHAVLLGEYATLSEAESALAGLPAGLRRLDPIVRTLTAEEQPSRLQ